MPVAADPSSTSAFVRAPLRARCMTWPSVACATSWPRTAASASGVSATRRRPVNTPILLFGSANALIWSSSNTTTSQSACACAGGNVARMLSATHWTYFWTRGSCAIGKWRFIESHSTRASRRTSFSDTINWACAIALTANAKHAATCNDAVRIMSCRPERGFMRLERRACHSFSPTIAQRPRNGRGRARKGSAALLGAIAVDEQVLAPAAESEQAGVELQLNEEHAFHVRIDELRVGDAIDSGLRQIGYVHGDTLGTERHGGKQARERLVVPNVFARHHEADHADVDVGVIREHTEASFHAAAGHVRRVVRAVLEAV